MKIIARYLVNQFLAVDQAANTMFGGHPDETLSSRLGRTINNNHRYFWVKWFRQFVDLLFFWDKEVDEDIGKILRHCEKSIMPLEQLNFRTVADYEVWSWSKNDISQS